MLSLSRVSEYTVSIEDRLIILFTSRISWKHTFDSMTLGFGEGDQPMSLRQQRRLQPRQAAATSQIGAAPSTAGGSAASSSYTFPAAPSSTPANINVTKDVSFSYINTTILPPALSLGDLSSNHLAL